MRQWAWRVVLVVSTVGAMATVALWVRSYAVLDIIDHERDDVNGNLSTSLRRLRFFSSMGRVSVFWSHRRVPHIFPPIDRPLPQVGKARRETRRQSRAAVVPAAFSLTMLNARVWEWRSFQVVKTSPGLPSHYVAGVGITLPHWFIILPCLVAPGLEMRRLGRRLIVARRWHRGRCVACGYDLRATPDRCPECGAVGGAR